LSGTRSFSRTFQKIKASEKTANKSLSSNPKKQSIQARAQTFWGAGAQTEKKRAPIGKMIFILIAVT